MPQESLDEGQGGRVVFVSQRAVDLRVDDGQWVKEVRASEASKGVQTEACRYGGNEKSARHRVMTSLSGQVRISSGSSRARSLFPT